MTNILPTNGASLVVREEVKVASRVSDDTAPSLSNTLDGNGKDIKNVRNIETKTLNGVNVIDELLKLGAVVSRSSSYADKKHIHELADVQGAQVALRDISKAIADVSGNCATHCAKKEHKHVVEDVDGLTELLKEALKNASVQSHEHPEIEKKIQYAIDMTALSASKNDLAALVKEQEKIISFFEKRIKEMENIVNENTKEIAKAVLDINTKSLIKIEVSESAKRWVTVTKTDEPYIIIDTLPEAGNIVVKDGDNEQMEVEVLPADNKFLVNFKKTKGPYTFMIRQ